HPGPMLPRDLRAPVGTPVVDDEDFSGEVGGSYAPEGRVNCGPDRFGLVEAGDDNTYAVEFTRG
ncbi:hypothetical protein N9903_01470, partial [bacterium]|nr:hypothetical protein [bacterium]